MNTKIGTSFGLALLMAIAVIATMFALGMFSAKEARADHNALSTNVHNVTMTPSTNSVNGKGSWNVTFGVSAALVAGTGTMTIQFPLGVVLPATIDKTRVSAGAGTELNPLTADPTVTVSTRTVIITAPATQPDGTAVVDTIDAGDTVTVFFSQLAGIINPAKSGAAGGTTAANQGDVSTSAQATATTIKSVTNTTFNKTISLGGKTSQVQGGAVTVTVGGFTPGLTVNLSGAVSGSAVVGSDRKATISGTMKGATGTVTATDTSGGTVTSGSIAVKAELTATATGKAGDTVTLTGKNFTAGSNVAGVSTILFGGSAITSAQATTSLPYTLTDRDADSSLDDFLIKIKVPSGAKKGVNQIKVTDAGGANATATIDVTGRSVTISPDSGPPGTVVTIVGSGFPSNRTAAAGNTVAISPVFGSTTKTNLFTDGSGNLPGSDQFTIPAAATTRAVITLTVTILGADSVNSTGSDKFTVTSRVLTAVPNSGPKGTKILVTGTKFTASDDVAANSITVGGASTTHSAANTTSAGDVPGISVSIPSGASVGSNTVSLTDGTLTGTTKFTVTVPTITAGVASATMGQSVPITGAGWVPSSAVTITLTSASTTVATKVATADGTGAFEDTVTIPSTVGVGPKTVTFTAADISTYGNTATAQNLSIPKAAIALGSSEAEVGSTVAVTASGFPPLSGLSVLTIGGADVRPSGVQTSDAEGGLTTEFTVPGVTGSNIVTVTIGSASVSTSLSVTAAKAPAAAATTAPATIFADVIANDDNLVRVWRFSNADQSWEFYDPRPAFESANTLDKSGAGDIVWVNVTAEQAFQGGTLFPGWNLISLK